MNKFQSSGSEYDQIEFKLSGGFLAENYRFILAGIFVSGLLSVVVAMSMKPIYTATTVIMPPQQSASGLGVALGNLGVLAGAVGGGLKNPSDLYVGMLKSRTVLDGVIEKNNLRERYGKTNLLFTRKALDGVTSVVSAKDGLIYVSVDDEDPKIAANIANSYVSQLKALNQRLAVTDAAQRRLFLEGQLTGVKERLTQAELYLRKTQEKTGLIAPEGQVKAVIESIASIKAQIAAKDVELSVLQSYATTNNPNFIKLQQEKSALIKQLASVSDNDRDVSFESLPKASSEYVRALRDFKYQEAMFELLSRQYELARYDEAKDGSLVQVLDYAVPPDYKSKPSRVFIVLFGSFLGAVLGVVWALLRLYLSKR